MHPPEDDTPTSPDFPAPSSPGTAPRHAAARAGSRASCSSAVGGRLQQKRSPWLTSPTRRSITVTLLAVIAAVVLSVLASTMSWFERGLLGWFTAIVTWLAMTVAHLGLTWAAFRGLSGDALRSAVHDPQRNTNRRTAARLFFGGDDAPLWSLTSALLALVALLGLTLIGSVGGNSPLTVLTFALVTACWFDVAVVYAEHYARLDLTDPDHRDGHLDFPGEARARHFDDYLYLSLGIQATFGTTDISVRTTALRRQVTTHSLIAFLFNAVIVAVAVAFLSSAMA